MDVQILPPLNNFCIPSFENALSLADRWFEDSRNGRAEETIANIFNKTVN